MIIKKKTLSIFYIFIFLLQSLTMNLSSQNFFIIYDGTNKLTEKYNAFKIYKQLIKIFKKNEQNKIKIYPNPRKIKTTKKAVKFCDKENRFDEIVKIAESEIWDSEITVIVLGNNLTLWDKVKKKIKNKKHIKNIIMINPAPKKDYIYRNKTFINVRHLMNVISREELNKKIKKEIIKELETSTDYESDEIIKNKQIELAVKIHLLEVEEKIVKNINIPKLEKVLTLINSKIKIRNNLNDGAVVQINLEDLIQLINNQKPVINEEQEVEDENESLSIDEELDDLLDNTCCWGKCNKKKVKSIFKLSAKVIPVIISLIIACVSN